MKNDFMRGERSRYCSPATKKMGACKTVTKEVASLQLKVPVLRFFGQQEGRIRLQETETNVTTYKCLQSFGANLEREEVQWRCEPTTHSALSPKRRRARRKREEEEGELLFLPLRGAVCLLRHRRATCY